MHRCPVLGNTAKQPSPQTETQWETNEWFTAAAPWMKTFLEGFGETIPIAIGLASGTPVRSVEGPVRAVGSWGILKHKIPRALRSRLTGYSPGPGSLVGFGFHENHQPGEIACFSCLAVAHGIEYIATGCNRTMKCHIFYKSRGVTCGSNVQPSPDGMNIGSCGTKVSSKPAIPTTANAGAVLASWSTLYGLVLDLAGRSFKGDF